MSYVLYGSKTSPFVRRIRMVLENLPYVFQEMDIFSPKDAEILKNINPINQIPVLIDGDQTIWDSRQIFNYLNHMHMLQNLDWEDENRLTEIDAAMNSAISIFLMKRSMPNLDPSTMYFSRQTERIEIILDHLKPYISNEGLTLWNFHTMSLYSLFEWASFRNVFTLEHRPECQKLLEVHADRSVVKLTAIPKV